MLEYKSKPADYLEALVGIIALSFIKTISIIIIYIFLHNYLDYRNYFYKYFYN